MKWRHSLIYLIVLVLIGGYYYYFEVVRKDQREAAAKKAKQVFHFQTSKVGELDLLSKNNRKVRLVKQNRWKIVAPLQAQVDEPTLQHMLSTLSTLHMDRTVVAAPKNLQPYGLQEPPLRIRFKIGKQWQELALGSKNPVGDGYYAKTGTHSEVFLVPEATWQVLHKSVNDLRRRELFTFKPDQVTGMQVNWQKGQAVHVEKQSKTHAWVAPEDPQKKISSSKVDNVLDQIQYLRADKFLEEKSQNLAGHGLTTPAVTVKLRLKNAKTVQLRLARQTAGKNRIAALSSQLPAVVQVDADIYKDLPKTVGDLEDRSLVDFKTDAVQRIDWQIRHTHRQLVAGGSGKWILKDGQGESREIKNTWHVQSLLYDVKQAEYEKALQPAPALPAKPDNSLALWTQNKQPAAILLWDDQAQPNPDKGKPGLMTVWLKGEGPTHAVQVKADLMEQIAKDLQTISAKPAK